MTDTTRTIMQHPHLTTTNMDAPIHTDAPNASLSPLSPSIHHDDTGLQHPSRPSPSPSLSTPHDAPIIDNLPITDGTILPVPAADLQSAAARLQPDDTIVRALNRLLDGGWSMSYQDTSDDFIIRFDPRSTRVTKKPPRPYTTTSSGCSCPGASIRGGCYHPYGWLIVNEALHPTTSLQCTLPALRFVSLCRLALADAVEDICIHASSSSARLMLSVDGMTEGIAHIDVATPVLLTITQQLAACDLERIVASLNALPFTHDDQILLDIGRETMLVVAGNEDDPVFIDGLSLMPLVEPQPLA